VLAAACAAVVLGLALSWARPGPQPVWVQESLQPAPTPMPQLPGQPLRISVNLATAEELQKLPGIGPVLARRIVDDRARNGQYARPEDLLRVKGIGPKTLESLKPYLQVP